MERKYGEDAAQCSPDIPKRHVSIPRSHLQGASSACLITYNRSSPAEVPARFIMMKQSNSVQLTLLTLYSMYQSKSHMYLYMYALCKATECDILLVLMRWHRPQEGGRASHQTYGGYDPVCGRQDFSIWLKPSDCPLFTCSLQLSLWDKKGLKRTFWRIYGGPGGRNGILDSQ